MQEFKGTRGPWRTVPAPYASEYSTFVLGPGEDEMIADVFGGHNARLIASAPALLEACIAYLKQAHGWGDGNCGCELCTKARTAIAAALGQHGDTP